MKKASLLSKSLKLISVIFVVLGIGLSLFYYYKSTPFYDYKPIFSDELSIQPISLKHNQTLEKNIRKKLLLPLLEKEKRILSGLHWLLKFIDDDQRFNDVFTDFIILANELKRGSRAHQSEIATQLLKNCLKRAIPKLKQLFPADEEGRWDFIGILPILSKSTEFRSTYYAFYKQNFSTNKIPNYYEHHELSFNDAVNQSNFEVMGDYLIDISFLHYFIKSDTKNTLKLPANRFKHYLAQFESFNYNLELDKNSDSYSEQAYLATHIPLVLTNYGEFKIPSGINTDKVKNYIDKTYHSIRYSVNDLDLLAEYLQCLKMLAKSNSDERIPELERLFFSLQRSNGSWGKQTDFDGDAYNMFHPTWAVLTALNHE
jgi:hypothetical protein